MATTPSSSAPQAGSVIVVKPGATAGFYTDKNSDPTELTGADQLTVTGSGTDKKTGRKYLDVTRSTYGGLSSEQGRVFNDPSLFNVVPSQAAAAKSVHSPPQPAQTGFWQSVENLFVAHPDKNGNVTSYDPESHVQTTIHRDGSTDIVSGLSRTHIDAPGHHTHPTSNHTRRHFDKAAVTPTGIRTDAPVTQTPLPPLPVADTSNIVSYQNGSVHYTVTQAEGGNFKLTTQESSGRRIDSTVGPDYLKAISQGQAGMGGFTKELDQKFPGHNFAADTKALAARQIAPSL